MLILLQCQLKVSVKGANSRVHTFQLQKFPLISKLQILHNLKRNVYEIHLLIKDEVGLETGMMTSPLQESREILKEIS